MFAAPGRAVSLALQYLCDVLEASLQKVKGYDQACRDRCKAIRRAEAVCRSEAQNLVPDQKLGKVDRDRIAHDLVGLVPMPDLRDPILSDCLRFGSLGRDL